jgi:hypothetical protein
MIKELWKLKAERTNRQSLIIITWWIRIGKFIITIKHDLTELRITVYSTLTKSFQRKIVPNITIIGIYDHVIWSTWEYRGQFKSLRTLSKLPIVHIFVTSPIIARIADGANAKIIIADKNINDNESFLHVKYQQSSVFTRS